MIKTNNIKSCAENIVLNINSNEIENLIDSIAEKNNLCVQVYSRNLTPLYLSAQSPYSILNFLLTNDLNRLYNKTISNNNTYFEIFSREQTKDIIDFKKDENRLNNQNKTSNQKPPPDDKMNVDTLIASKIVTTNSGQELFILLSSNITPINSTVETLRIQLLIITAIIIILSVFLAAFFSKKISKPIIDINNSAKELAKNNYQVTFNSDGYLEICELNDTLNYATKELSKVEKLRNELIANVSHDLRTPLTMISGYAEMMRDIPGEANPENIQVIIDETNRLSELVNDILDLSKLNSKTQPLNKTCFNLTKSIKSIINRYSKLVENKNYNIIFNYKYDVYVTADEVSLERVIYNLINNAINYTGDDKTVIVSQSVKNNKVLIEISDSGQGISKEEINYIWQRYYRAKGNHKREVVGSGLGLSIVKSILDSHNAKYGVNSKPGAGSTFWFEIDACRY